MPCRCVYRVVETSSVTDDSLTRMLNAEASEGWIFDGFHFAMREGSHRPAMAFALFHKEVREDSEQ